MASLKDMFATATPLDWVLIFSGLTCSIINGCLLTGINIIMGLVLNEISSTPSDAGNFCLYFVYLGCAAFIVSIGQVGFLTAASERMTAALRKRFLQAVLSQEITFFDDVGAARLSSSVAESAILYREALGEKFASIWSNLALFLSGIVAGLNYCWQLALVIIAVLPLLAIAGGFVTNVMTGLAAGQLQAYARAGAVAEETLMLIRTVTSLNAQQSRLRLFESEVRAATTKAVKEGTVKGIGFALTFFVFFGAFALSYYVGVLLVTQSRTALATEYPPLSPRPQPYCVINGVAPPQCSAASSQFNVKFESNASVCACFECACGCYHNGSNSATACLSGGAVLITFFSVLFGGLGLGQAVPGISAFIKGRAAAKGVFEIIRRSPAIKDSDFEPGPATSVRGHIEFRNVSFAYPTRKDMPVLTNLTLDVPAGKRVSIVGQSGSGKSTLCALLLRFYEPLGGEILLDGTPVEKVSLAWLRSVIGLVAQEPLLFNLTVRENIRLGSTADVSDEAVEEACKAANAHSFIMGFPQGYSTRVGSSGSQLSGGQKQRIAIARALIKNPSVLVLDEATAALDTLSEQLVNEAIDRLLSSSQGRTTITIAHRISSIENCDWLFYLEKGAVVEQGTFAQLSQRTSGRLATMISLANGAAKPGLMYQRSEVAWDSPPAALPGINESFAESSGLGTKESPVKMNAKSPSQDDKVKKHVSFGRAWAFMRQDAIWYIPATLGALTNGIIFPIEAVLEANLIAILFGVNASWMLQQAALFALGFVGLAVASAMAHLCQHSFFGLVNGRATARVRLALFKHLLGMEMAFFDEAGNSVGSLASKLASDAALLKAAVSDRLEVMCSSSATLITGIIVAMVASWKLSLVILAVFPALVFATTVQYMILGGLANADSKALVGASETLTEAINGIRTVQAFGMMPKVLAVYAKQLSGPLSSSVRKGFISGVGLGLSNSFLFFIYALAYYYGSTLVASAEISFTALNQSLLGLLMCAYGLGQALALSPDLSKGQQALDSVCATLDRPSRIDAWTHAGAKPSSVVGHVKFTHVSFAYPSRVDVKVMQDFDLDMPAGSTIALVGSSGSGKSTCIALLERFYDVDGGSIALDGNEVASLNPAWLRSQIGLVTQEPLLFDQPIVESIRMGRPEASDADCIEASKLSNAFDFIMKLPDGFQTRCGPRGSQLSGGQRQRVVLARALVKNPRILLLDEATSALDEESQRVVQDALDKLLKAKQRTTVIVAHRLSTVRNADLICVCDGGRIVERGTYEALVQRNGAFCALLNAEG